MLIRTILILASTFGMFALILFPPATVKSYFEERLPDEFNTEKLALDQKGDFPIFTMPDLTEMLNQPFHYLGHGGQAIAFASNDGKYVLKFFLIQSLHGKKKHPMPKPTHWIPSHRKARYEKRKQKRIAELSKTLRNYTIAYEMMGKSTGIIAMHLTATNDRLPTIAVFDQYGNKHFIDLKRSTFVIQHKLELVKDKFAKLPTLEEKKELLLSMSQFFEKRVRQGLVDLDGNFSLETNYGFLGKNPMQLDIGRVEFREEMKARPDAEIARIQKLLRAWAKEHQLPDF